MLVIRRKLRTKIRAAFDIGSGEHKLVVAAVNGTSVKVLHSEVSTVLLAQDLTRPGGDGALSAGALRASKEALTDLAERAGAQRAVAAGPRQVLGKQHRRDLAVEHFYTGAVDRRHN